MITVNVTHARAKFSQLLRTVETGEEVTIERAGRPVARLVRLESAPPRRRLGALQRRLNVPDDFDAPLPDDVLALFEGR